MKKTLYLARRKTFNGNGNVDYSYSYYTISTSQLFSAVNTAGNTNWYNKKETQVDLCPKLFGPLLPSQYRLKPGEGPVKIPIQHFGDYVIWGEKT